MTRIKHIAIFSLAVLTFLSCNKRNDEFKDQQVTPEKAFQSFVKEYQEDINIHWIYQKDFNHQWIANFKLEQSVLTINRLIVNTDWDHLTDQKSMNIPFQSDDFTLLPFNDFWSIKAFNQENDEHQENVEVAQRLSIDFELGQPGYINPNYGFRIYTQSAIPQSDNHLSGAFQLILYAYNEELKIHNYYNIPVTHSTSYIDITPEMLIPFQQFDHLEIHLFQRQIFDFEWFNKTVAMQVITSQAFTFPFIIE